MSNSPSILRRLSQIATLLEIRGDSPFRAGAYSRAARALKSYDVCELVESGTLTSIQGIGKGLAQEITALVHTGTSPLWAELQTELPVESLLELGAINGLGAKSIRSIYQTLQVTSVGELEYACQENRLIELEGFGAKKQSKILAEIARIKCNRSLFRYGDLAMLAEHLRAQLLEAEAITAVVPTGKLRRACEVLEAVEFVVQASVAVLLEVLAGLAETGGIQTEGQTVRAVSSGVPLICYCTDVECYGWTLLCTTGSSEHVQALGDLANWEHGHSELEIYQNLNLPWIPPELREGTGEIEAARQGRLPNLVRRSDLRGVLHLHTQASDGSDSLETMVQAALRQGYQYVGISDHSQAAYYAGGLKLADIHRQHQEIDALNVRYAGRIRILKGIEADILPDGSLDYDAEDREILKSFDFVVASVHSQLRMSSEAMTKRLIRAAAHPQVTMLGHWSGRILLGRQGSEFDRQAVLAAAATHRTAIEFNASPYRLDLDWREIQQATAQGVKISVNPDAHSSAGFEAVDLTLGVARKGWLEPAQTLNTLSADEFLDFAAAP